MTRNRNKYRDDYTSEFHPKSKGQVYHKPRRNYWGNLYDEDTIEGRERLFIDESGTTLSLTQRTVRILSMTTTITNSKQDTDYGTTQAAR